MTERQTVAGAYEKIESHEEICAVRYEAIGKTLQEVKDGLKGHNRAAWAIAMSILGFLAVQAWNGAQDRLAHLERPAVIDAPLP